MSAPKHPVVLVTGTSSGIGLALARLLWETDYRVAITAREHSLKNLDNEAFSNNDRFLILPMDVTSAEDRRQTFKEIQDRWGGVDILVNNAGISYRAVIEHMSQNDELLQLRTNYFAPMSLTRLVLPWMRQNRFGKIINVSSVGGMMAMPTMGSYSASKFALEGASEALWYELKPWGVNVTLVQPGFVRSNSFKNVYQSEKSQVSRSVCDAYARYYMHMEDFITKLMNNSLDTPEKIAKRIIDVIENPSPPLRLPGTMDAYFFSLLRRLVPRRLYHWLLFRSLPGIKHWGNIGEN